VYEVLLGDASAVRWASNASPPPGAKTVEGGFEANGTPLLIAQTRFGGAILPAKAWGWKEGALVATNGGEREVREYNILIYN